MPDAAARSRFQLSLRTLAWLAIVVPLAMFAAYEHHQRRLVEHKLDAAEWLVLRSRAHNEALVREYHELVDKQQHAIQRHNNPITSP
jgi:hypothetical protein